jgi:CHASE3 domain sensor protein
MDTALKTFYTNFLEYSVTGQKPYKDAYLAAQKNIEARIATVQPVSKSDKETHDISVSIRKRLDAPPTPSQPANYLVAGILAAIAIGLSLI